MKRLLLIGFAACAFALAPSLPVSTLNGTSVILSPVRPPQLAASFVIGPCRHPRPARNRTVADQCSDGIRTLR
jgi:hypothetical protein